eukprot:jgi/Galph1/623/GphlegSOOS_G5348.1
MSQDKAVSKQSENVSSSDSQIPCADYFGKFGICPKGDSCPFFHGEDAVIVRSEEDILSWQKEELQGGNQFCVGYGLESIAENLRHKLLSLLNHSKNFPTRDNVEESGNQTSQDDLQVKKPQVNIVNMKSLKSSGGLKVESKNSKRLTNEAEQNGESKRQKLTRLSRPVVPTTLNSPIPWKLRQQTAELLAVEFVARGDTEEVAAEKALKEEEKLFLACADGGKTVYANSVSHYWRKLRTKGGSGEGDTVQTSIT